MIKRKKRQPDAGEAKYQLTSQEHTALGKHLARRAAEMPAPRLRVETGAKGTTLSVRHPNQLIGYALLKEALGTADSDFVSGLIEQLAKASSQDGQIDESRLNFMLAVVKSVKPKRSKEPNWLTVRPR